jgi:hypothetical protein
MGKEFRLDPYRMNMSKPKAARLWKQIKEMKGEFLK